MFDIDNKISELCLKFDVNYTRYADDMTFSTSVADVLSSVHAGIKVILAGSLYPKVTLNERKIVNSSKKHLRAVTGIVISNQGTLSLGRERKRLIRAMSHRSSLGILTLSDEAKLDGLLSFTKDIEPDFALKMRRRRVDENSG